MGSNMNPNEKFLGWNGNSSLDAENVLDSVVTFKKNSSLPTITIVLSKEQKVLYRRAKIKFDNVLYPLGQCLRVIYPEDYKNATLIGIILTIKKNESYETKNFVVHLMDKKSGTVSVVYSRF